MVLETSVEIDASPEELWSVLADFPAYPEWNPFIRSIEGEMRVGSRLVVRLRPPGGREMTIRPTVLAADPAQEFRWLGHLLVPGLFDGEHYFRISQAGPGRVRFVHGENFRGLLLPLLKGFLERDTRQGFERMNEALKERVAGMP